MNKTSVILVMVLILFGAIFFGGWLVTIGVILFKIMIGLIGIALFGIGFYFGRWSKRKGN